MLIHPDTQRVLKDVAVERVWQELKGYTHEHDDKHTIREMIEISFNLIIKDMTQGYYTREGLIAAAAVLVATIESGDRRNRRDNSNL